MKSVMLVRLWTGSHGTFGRISVGGRSWWTLERPAWGEHPAIPMGAYPLTFGMFYGGDGPGGHADYPAYEVEDVPGRSQIKIHVANIADQLRGCIAPGLAVGFPTVGGIASLGVVSSGDAFRLFMSAMDGEPGELLVQEDF